MWPGDLTAILSVRIWGGLGAASMMGEGCHGTASDLQVLETVVPADHLLRRIDRLLDFEELNAVLAPHYSRGGRPSIPPELLIRMALIGRLYAIAPERRLCEEVRYNLADLTPVFHPAGTRDRGLLSRRSAGEATAGMRPVRCWLSPAAKAAGVA